MRREGRQHGMVLTHPVRPFLPSDTRPISKRYPNQLNGPFMGRIYAMVPSKPTNSSRFTSRCGRPRCRGCHDHPVTKARAKAKGNHKHRDQISDFLLEWDCYRADEGDESDNGDKVVAAEVAGGGGGGGGDEVVCQEGGGGDWDDEGWVLVEEVQVSVS